MRKSKKEVVNLIFIFGIILVIFIVGFSMHAQNNNDVVKQNYSACSLYWSRGGLVEGDHPWPRDCTEVLDGLILPQVFD